MVLKLNRRRVISRLIKLLPRYRITIGVRRGSLLGSVLLLGVLIVLIRRILPLQIPLIWG